jgi:hypothetical protein
MNNLGFFTTSGHSFFQISNHFGVKKGCRIHCAAAFSLNRTTSVL